MAYHTVPVQPVGWATVLGFQFLLSDSCPLRQGSLTDPVPLHCRSHLHQQDNTVSFTFHLFTNVTTVSLLLQYYYTE